MHFDLIQSISVAGNAATANDDRCGAAARLAWMIDGATDLGEPGLMGTRGGAAWLACAANRAFAAAGAQPLSAIVQSVFERLADAYGAEQVRAALGPWEQPSAAFLAVALADAAPGETALDIAWLADCACLHLRGTTILRPGPQANPAEVQQAAELANTGDIAIAALRTHRARPTRHVLGIDPDHAHHVHHARITVLPGDELLLMTDGVAALFDDYAVPLPDCVARLRGDGLPGLVTDLRAIERADPDCTRFPRFKRSDDATALWLRIAA